MNSASALTPLEVTIYVKTQLRGMQPDGEGYRGPCPHPDHPGDADGDNCKMTADGLFICYSHGCKGNIFSLHRELTALEQKEATREVYEIVGRPPLEKKPDKEIVATYGYTDVDGSLRYQAVRYEPKTFKQRRPDGEGGWFWNMKDVTPVPYHLPKVAASTEVFIVEGEKDVESLEALGIAATCNSGGAGKWRPELNEHFRNKNVVILPDNDEPGRAHGDLVARNLSGIAASVKLVALPDLPEKGDVSDWIATGGTADQLRELAAAAELFVPPAGMALAVIPNNEWRVDLFVTRAGPRPVLANALTVLQCNLPEHFGFNEFTSQPVFRMDCPAADAKAGDAVNDHHIRQLTNYIQRLGIFVGVDIVGQAVYAEAQLSAHRFHPVRDYLTALEWDGTARVEAALIDLMGCEDSQYVRAVIRCLFIGAVARIMDPGCKLDTMPIFEGEQGIFKSSAIEALVPHREWFTDHLPDVSDKDAKVQVQGIWILEVAELGFLKGRGSEKVKAFLSSRVDKFRPPYGRTSTDHPRQCIFIGSTNDDAFLDDATGARRFWPVKPTRIDLDGIKKHRDQLWAEAVALYRGGAHWWMDDETEMQAAKQQADRFVEDNWTPLVERWCNEPTETIPTASSDVPPDVGFIGSTEPMLSEPGRVLTHEILTHAIGKPIDRWSKGDEMRVSKILRHLRYQRGAQTMVDGVRRRFYYAPGFEMREAA